MKNKKGFISIEVFCIFCLTTILYIVAFYPFLQGIINSIGASFSATEVTIISFIPLVFLLAFMINIFKSSTMSGGSEYA